MSFGVTNRAVAADTRNLLATGARAMLDRIDDRLMAGTTRGFRGAAVGRCDGLVAV